MSTTEPAAAPSRTTLTAQVSEPLRRFMHTQAGSAALLALATASALAWANSPWSGGYEALFHTSMSVEVDGHVLAKDLRHWIDEALMALFFFVVGLEVRREFSMGELTDRRRVVVPLVAGIGGMVVPVVLFLLLVPAGDAATGWGIVIATDTAFLLGALAIVGPKPATQLRIFLLTTAIVDDLVAISVIGLVYADDTSGGWLLVAGGALVAFWLLGRLRVQSGAVYALVGGGLWLATVQAGVHATIAGMAAGLLVTAYAPRRGEVEVAASRARAFRQSPLPGAALHAKRSLERAISPNERMLAQLHPWASYVIVPLFALAYAGIDLRGGALGAALGAPLTWAVVVGLAGGKALGLTLGAVGAQRMGWGRLPVGVSPRQVAGGGALSGIGFTVSLLIASLAFRDSPELREQATVGILVAAVAATLLGWLLFRFAAWRHGERSAGLPITLAEDVDAARDHVLGNVDAPLTLVEYADFECPFCSRATGTVHELRERFGDDLRYVFRHLPLEDVHPHALLAAQVAEAAADQGRFWELHDRLFDHQDELDDEQLLAQAAALGLDVDAIVDDLEHGDVAAQVREDVASAEASGARSTPTFFVNGTRVTGAYDADTLAALLETGRTAPDAPR